MQAEAVHTNSTLPYFRKTGQKQVLQPTMKFLIRKIVPLVVVLGTSSHSMGSEFVAPYVQTVSEDVELILDLANVGPGDYLIDLGSGDGRFVIEAAKRGAMGHGVELNPDLISQSNANAKNEEVSEKVVFVQEDIFGANIRLASVVTLYLFPEANIRLRPKLLSELQPGTRVVSNSFHMGEWEPDAREQGRTSGGALLWIVPANVKGSWKIKVGKWVFIIDLDQEFQKVEINPSDSDKSLRVKSINLVGAVLHLSATYQNTSFAFHGKVKNSKMEGIVEVSEDSQRQILEWTGVREPFPRLLTQ